MIFEDRFWSKVNKTDSCWLWTASKAKSGYGVISGRSTKGPSMLYAHRVSWELSNGSIQNGLHIDHRVCRNKACVNPGHMVLCTNSENVMQPDGGPGRNVRKTHCKRGHQFTLENTVPSKNGRKCRACSLEYAASYNPGYYERNKTKSLESARQWRQNNPDRVVEYNRQYHRAKRVGSV